MPTIEEIEQSYISKGEPIEGAYRSFIAAVVIGEMTQEQDAHWRGSFFAGAAAAMHHVQEGSSERDCVDRSMAILLELEEAKERLYLALVAALGKPH